MIRKCSKSKRTMKQSWAIHPSLQTPSSPAVVKRYKSKWILSLPVLPPTSPSASHPADAAWVCVTLAVQQSYVPAKARDHRWAGCRVKRQIGEQIDGISQQPRHSKRNLKKKTKTNPRWLLPQEQLRHGFILRHTIEMTGCNKIWDQHLSSHSPLRSVRQL